MYFIDITVIVCQEVCFYGYEARSYIVRAYRKGDMEPVSLALSVLATADICIT